MVCEYAYLAIMFDKCLVGWKMLYIMEMRYLERRKNLA